jgi:hypothetical protein
MSNDPIVTIAVWLFYAGVILPIAFVLVLLLFEILKVIWITAALVCMIVTRGYAYKWAWVRAVGDFGDD